MALRLKPSDSSFYTLLADSAAFLVEGAGLLGEMLSETADRASIAERMRDAEHRADENTHAIVRKVNSSFVTPIDREDIYSLASQLDDCMDYMEEAVDRTFLYEVTEVPDGVAQLVEVIQRCADITAEAMPRLKGMVNLEEYWIEVNRLENAADKHYRRIVARLFGGQLAALEVMKLKDIVDSLEHAVDAFERVANTVEQIHVKES